MTEKVHSLYFVRELLLLIQHTLESVSVAVVRGCWPNVCIVVTWIPSVWLWWQTVWYVL